jgi:hypothetical protein
MSDRAITSQPYTAPPVAIRAAADAVVRMRSHGARGLDSLPESTQGFWVRDAAAALTAAGPLLEAAALRSYANRHHYLADGHGPISTPGDPIDPDAWCACGCSWIEDDDGGCLERDQLLADADALERAPRGPGGQ